jgi:transcriptional regulator with XRE-family HTH domain
MPRSKTKTSPGYETPFATRLRELIDEAGIPQSALAEHIGVTRQAVSAYSLGASVPDIEKFEGIADYFGVSTEYLLGRTDIKKADASKQAAAEYLGLSEKAIDTIRNLQGIHLEQNPENDYKITAKPAEPLPEIFSQWLEAVNLSLLVSDMWRMACSTISAQDSGWNKEKYELTQMQKDAIWDLKEHGYVTLSMTQQVSFFSGSAAETFKHSLDDMINDTIVLVNEQNSPMDEGGCGVR